jgi:hypothetical protein
MYNMYLINWQFFLMFGYLEKYISESKYAKNQYSEDNERKGTRKTHKSTPT